MKTVNETAEKTMITIGTKINAPVERVWECYVNPFHLIHWNHASDDWFSPWAENDFREGGKIVARMEARDGSEGFDFTGTYTKIEKHRLISFRLDDGRTVEMIFNSKGDQTEVTETFEAENVFPVEQQRQGWQAILDNFKRYVEKTGNSKPLHIEITIDAPVGKVYQIMLDEKTYPQWTKAFNPSSRYEGSWEKGSEIRFLGDDESGTSGGMVSRIRENIPNKFVSIEHLGIIEGNSEKTSGPDIEKWKGALENYTFKEVNGKTLVQADCDSSEEYDSYFRETWPKALKLLKEICEQ